MDEGYWEDIITCEVDENIVRDRKEWRERLRVADPTCMEAKIKKTIR